MSLHGDDNCVQFVIILSIKVFMVAFQQFHHMANISSEGTPLVLEGNSSSRRIVVAQKGVSSVSQGRTWEIFLQAANTQFGVNKVKHIFTRYGINTQTMIQQARPLLAKHVHMLEVGVSCVHREDLDRYAGSARNSSLLAPSRIQQLIHKHIPVPCNRLNVAPFQLSGTPTSTKAFFFHDPHLMDQEMQLLFSDIGNLPHRYAYLERLCKGIIPRELPVGMLVPAPDPSGHKGALDYYEIYDVITTGDGLVAYAFKPLSKSSRLQPMILFRGSPYHLSGNDVLETWLNNMQKNIGWLGYQSSRGKLAKLAHDTDFCGKNQRITVGGFSLGGAFAQLFTADHPERIAEAIFFNDPSIDAETADMFSAKINSMKKLPTSMKVRIFRTKGDFVHYANEKHLFCDVHHPQIDIRLTEIEPKPNLTTKQRHGWRHFDCAIPGNYTERVFTRSGDLDQKLNNAKRGEEVLWYERVRLFFGSYLIFPVFYILSRIFQYIEQKTGLAVLRHTVPKRSSTLR
ncbi:MAG: hypothetical protein KGZ39_05190 [Simkania sp.]|nr:hypothetical protein [Simkania sp.]